MFPANILCFMVIFINPILSRDACRQVELSLGSVQGIDIKISDSDHVVCSFMGVPYAEPPVGELRFRKTAAKKPWSGKFFLHLLLANEYKPACWQNASISPQSSMSEDCLYANIFVDSRCLLDSQDSLCPVLFYIHGGAYEFDSPRMFDPQDLANNIASRNIILITFSYRLGVLGFWSTGTEEASGNWAFHDMIEALKFTKREIGRFGGDADRLTMMGHSTGGCAAAALTLSPETEGLFSQVVIMSESASRRSELDNNVSDYQELAVRVGCSTRERLWNSSLTSDSYETIVGCMRKVDIADLVNRMNDLRCCDDDIPTTTPEQIMNFAARHIGKVELPPRLMTPKNDGPAGLFPQPLRQLRANRRPLKLMIGSTINELGNQNRIYEAKASPYAAAQLCSLFVSKKLYKNHWQKILLECRKNYGLFAGLHERFYSKSNFSFWSRLMTSMNQEYQYFAPIQREYSSVLDNSRNSTVYLYSFDFERKTMEGIFPWHSRDLTFIFGLHKNFKFDEDDLKIRDIYIDLLLNFVIFGDPTPEGKTNGYFKWQPLTRLRQNHYLSINLPQPTMKPYYHKNSNWFWNFVAPWIEKTGRLPEKYVINEN
uniref:Carboxylesterase type B domain-containing protein n=1 Tax=Romanomermis culicivorax TaxID=13658 RepID=A0A915HWJ5_ROMCU